MEKGELESVRIKRIGVLSLANLFAIVYAFFGLLFGAFVTFGFFIPSIDSFGFFDILFGRASIVIHPVLFGIIGLIMGAIGALIYNLVAKITKGVELCS